MGVRIMMGDSKLVLRALYKAGERFDCAIVDPPYGQTSLPWDKRVPGWPSMVRDLLLPTGSMWVFGSLRLFMETASEFAEWKMSHDIVWEKHNGSGAFNDRFRNVHEVVAHFYPADVPWAQIYRQPQYTNDATARTLRRKNKPQQWGALGPSTYESKDGGPRLMRSVLQVRSEHGRAQHPTQKPEALYEPLLRYACPVGGRILDPFAGSGTTALVAKRIGIHATLIEARADYVAVQEDRMARDAPLFQSQVEPRDLCEASPPPPLVSA